MAKKYKDDLDGVILMRKTFPKKQNNIALEKVSGNKQLIKNLSKKLFNKNHALFGKVGLNEDDVESLFTCYSYVLMSKISKDEAKILTNFLKQRGTKLVEKYRSVSQNILETPQEVELDVESLAVSNLNPEQIIIAQEEAGTFLTQIRIGLIERSKSYVADFYDKNRKDLRGSTTLEDLNTIIEAKAFKYAERKYRDSEPLDYQEFKKSLVSEMSKLLKTAREA